MSNIDFDKLWSFISQFNAAFEVPSHLLCTICKKLISNCRKGPCNCKYCVICITRYINDNDVICCGRTLRCNSFRLNLHKNIIEDQNTNAEIISLIIQCPHSGCSYYNDIWNVCKHSETCSNLSNQNNAHQFKNVKETPFIWGCEISNGFESYYDRSHMENSKEIKALKEAIENMKKEKKTEMENVFKINKSQVDEIKRLSSVIDKMEKELTELKASKRQQNITNDRLNKSNADFRKTLNKTRSDVNNIEKQLKTFIESEMLSLNCLVDEKIETLTKCVKNLSNDQSKLSKNIDKLNSKEKDCSLTIDAILSDISQLEQQAEGICFNLSALMFKVENLEGSRMNLTEEKIDRSTCMYTWSVNNFSNYKDELSKRKSRKVTSKDFHASDKSYKIHFDLYPGGFGSGEGEFLSLFAVIKKINQRQLNAALSYDITVSISSNGVRHNTVKLDKVVRDNSKLEYDMDRSVGIEKLILIERIFSEPSLLVDNSLTFEFIVRRKNQT